MQLATRFNFGNLFDDKITLNDCGRVVEKVWLELPRRYQNIMVDEFSVMPDHFHGVLFRVDASRDVKPVSVTLSEVIRGFKSRSARQINLILDATGVPVWQRGFYDRIIRNQAELDMIRRYIINNPIQWNPDEPNPPEIR